DGLAAIGFHRGQTGNATATVAATEVRVTHTNLGFGQLVLRYLQGVGKVVEVPSTGTAQVVVVIGADFRGVAAPTTAATTTTVPAPTTTTTTLPPNPGTPPPGTKDVGHQV